MTPTLAVDSATGAEDTPIAIHIDANLVDTDGSETLVIVVAGVPAGATLSAGTNNGDGTWTLTPADLPFLTLTPPQDFAGSITLTVTAVALENGHAASISAPLTVSVTGVADAPILGVHTSTGAEDTAIALTINAATVGAGETLGIVISGVPAGGTLSAGHNNGDGTWTLTAGDLAGLTFTPPLHASGTFNLTVVATASENGTSASTSQVLSIDVSGVATAPTLSVGGAAGLEGTPVPLTINAALVDTDGSETLSITIGGLPTGAVLSAGTNNGDGTAERPDLYRPCRHAWRI